MEHRIVSLLPSSTEIACALGFRDQLVGRSHECDFPGGLDDLPACTSARLDPDASSREIDDRVKDLVSRALSVYDVDAEKLQALAPTLILTQDQCEVCAASPRDLADALAAWTGAAPEVLSLHPRTLGDVFDDIRRVGSALGAEERAHQVTRALGDRITEIGERTGALPNRPRVACLEWLDPLMSAGNWLPELLRLAGGEPLFGAAGSHSPWLEEEALVASDPDVLILLPCGFDLVRVRAETPELLERPGLSGLRAVREGRVFRVDGNAYFNRPGPRLVDSLEILAEILHPELFAFGHRGTAWEAVPGRAPR